MASQLPRWSTGAFGLIFLLLLVGVAMFLYDHDSVKKLPVVGGLPWGRLIGNTALQAQARYVAEHSDDLEVAYRQQPSVVVVGDSLAGKWPIDGAAAWNREIRGLNAVSLGVASDRTQHLLYRIRSGEFSRLSPLVGVLIIGTNNVNRNTPEETRDAVLRVIDELGSVWPDTSLVVVGVLPRELPEGQARQRRIDVLNDLLSAATRTRERVTFVPVRNEFLSGNGGLNPALYEDDGIHLTAAGYETLTERVAPIVAERARQKSGEVPSRESGGTR
ncbi:MAG: GDSL-type esterase/lipase family protein [Vicinamibacterales bacterium]